ncbi:carbohydrate binding domain-containing protein [Candidatus Woesebacteria bacterium]|nr:carbohydrate binding domain-containing protein [Candidatus Woesebacteria bacterium]
MPLKTKQEYLNMVLGTTGLTIQECLKRLAGVPNLDITAQDAANRLVGTTGRTIQECLNLYVGVGAGSTLTLQEAINRMDVDIMNNGDFENAPAFTAATTTNIRFINGTAAGSVSDTLGRGWGTRTVTGTASAQYDTAEFHSGAVSMKILTGATGSAIEVSNVTTGNLYQHVSPDTVYDYSFWMKTQYTSGDSTLGAHIGFKIRNAAGSNTATTVSSNVKTTTGWTQYTGQITTNSTADSITPSLQILGNAGTGTMIMTAWFDDIVITRA